MIHKLRENEYLDGDPPIFSCTCGFTGPRIDVDRHVVDNKVEAPLDPLLRTHLISSLYHELSLAAIKWAKADELADDAGAELDRCAAAVKDGAAAMDERDPRFAALVRVRGRASDVCTWACQREDQALEHLKAISKKLTQALEKM